MTFIAVYGDSFITFELCIFYNTSVVTVSFLLLYFIVLTGAAVLRKNDARGFIVGVECGDAKVVGYSSKSSGSHFNLFP